MANYNAAIQVDVLTSAPSVTRQALGKVMFATTDVGAGFTEVYRTYTADNLPSDDTDLNAPARLKGDAFFAQSPHPPQLLIAKLAGGTIAEDLSAIHAAVKGDGDDFYGVLLDSRVRADIEAAATWTQPRSFKLFIYTTSDTDVIDGTAPTDNVMHTLSAADRDAVGIWHESATEYPDIALTSYKMAANPDQKVVSWSNAQLTGVSRQDDEIDDTELGRLQGFHGMAYLSFFGISVMRDGKLHSGKYVDEKISVDWFSARLAEDLAQLMVDYDSLQQILDPYAGGLGDVYKVVSKRVNTAEEIGHIAKGRTTIIMPEPEDIVDRQAVIKIDGVMHGGIDTFSVTARLV